MKNKTFSNFIRSDPNWFAFDVLKKIAIKGTCPYSPIILVGPSSGVGKTHLLKALYDDFVRNHPDAVCIYTRSCDMTNHLNKCLRAGRSENFYDRYAFADLLLIDDLDIQGKDGTQYLLYQLIRSMTQQRKVIVIASSAEPSKVTSDEGLHETMETSLTIRIGMPDMKIKLAMARVSAEKRQLCISDDTLRQMIEGCTTHFDIEHMIDRIDTYRNINMIPISSDSITKILACTKGLPEIVIDSVCRHFSLCPTDLAHIRKTKSHENVRAVAAYLLRKHTLLSLPEIAACLHIDHSDIFRGVLRVNNRMMAGDVGLSSTIESIECEIFELLA